LPYIGFSRLISALVRLKTLKRASKIKFLKKIQKIPKKRLAKTILRSIMKIEL